MEGIHGQELMTVEISLFYYTYSRPDRFEFLRQLGDLRLLTANELLELLSLVLPSC